MMMMMKQTWKLYLCIITEKMTYSISQMQDFIIETVNTMRADYYKLFTVHLEDYSSVLPHLAC